MGRNFRGDKLYIERFLLKQNIYLHFVLCFHMTYLITTTSAISLLNLSSNCEIELKIKFIETYKKLLL